ncbi:MAG: endonuclease III [Eubacteriales bacterium]|nr:endonuclease III [Eubacteriales bacterium]
MEVPMYGDLMNKVFQFEEKIGNQYNMLKGDLLNKEEKAFVLSDMNAFMTGLISDQSVKAELAWALPYRLKERLGHFDVGKIATEIPVEVMTMIIRQKPALHRYPGNIAKYIISACQLLMEKYAGDAGNIWNHGETAAQIVDRLEEFKGISHKKAALGCLMLVRDLDLDIPDKENINIAYDVHIRRICLRTGMAKEDSMQEITRVGKMLYPKFPGRLTSSFWAIGREICRPQQPMCEICPINEFCEKVGVNSDFNDLTGKQI